MRRDPSRLTISEFDLLIVGAGIYGATAAWDATQRGLSVALIDKGDLGSGTSFNNAKTVHGGVRSLQRGHLGEMREYLRERRALLRILPHLVHPLPFLLPTSRALTRHKATLGVYFRLNDLLARDRNDLADPSKHLPASHLVSRDECLRLAPGIDPDGVTGGVVWHDAQFSNSDRAELAFISTAVRHGLVAANYVEATSLLSNEGRTSGVMAHDHVTDRPFPIRARAVLLAAGGWTDAWLAQALPRPRRVVPAWSVAMNLVMSGVPGTHAVGGSARGRLFFLAPWRGAVIGGTSHDPWPGRADQLSPRREDLEQLLDDLRAAFPRAGLEADRIRLVHRGLLPATVANASRVTLLRDSALVDHAADGCRQLLSLVGVRYTTARQSAERAIDLVVRGLGVTARPCATAVTPLDGGRIDRFDRFAADAGHSGADQVERDRIARLVVTYGTAWPDVLALGRAGVEQPAEGGAPGELLRPLGATCAVTGAEILYACREEMAVHLTDALLRRTEAGTRGHPGADAVQAAARVMGQALGWAARRQVEETRAVDRVYDTPLGRGN